MDHVIRIHDTPSGDCEVVSFTLAGHPFMAISAGPRYGLSWQVTPTGLDRMMRDEDPGKVARVVQAFLKMKRFDIAALERAYAG